MTAILGEVLAANAKYAATFGDKGGLALPPARRFAILTCMDARLDPAKYAGLTEGDAHVIRNAGGRASDDAIGGTRSELAALQSEQARMAAELVALRAQVDRLYRELGVERELARVRKSSP